MEVLWKSCVLLVEDLQSAANSKHLANIPTAGIPTITSVQSQLHDIFVTSDQETDSRDIRGNMRGIKDLSIVIAEALLTLG